MRKWKIISVWYQAMAIYGIEGENKRKGNWYILWENGTFGMILKIISMGNISFRKIGETLSIGTFSSVQKVSERKYRDIGGKKRK